MNLLSSLLYILLLIFLSNASSDRNAQCFTSANDPRATIFEGVAKVLTESASDGIRIIIDVGRIVSDSVKALEPRSHLLEAYLTSPLCLSSVSIGSQQTWSGTYRLFGNKLRFLVQIVRKSSESVFYRCGSS